MDLDGQNKFHSAGEMVKRSYIRKVMSGRVFERRAAMNTALKAMLLTLAACSDVPRYSKHKIEGGDLLVTQDDGYFWPVAGPSPEVEVFPWVTARVVTRVDGLALRRDQGRIAAKAVLQHCAKIGKSHHSARATAPRKRGVLLTETARAPHSEAGPSQPVWSNRQGRSLPITQKRLSPNVPAPASSAPLDHSRRG